MGKFTNIQFPIYISGTDKPEFKFYKNKLLIEKTNLLIDDLTIPKKTFAERLLILDATKKDRYKFKYTANDLQQLILIKKLKWGIDNSGKIFDFTKPERFKAKEVRVAKIKDNLVWFKTISYPFELKYGLERTINPYMWVTLVYVEKTWLIFDIEYSYSNTKEITI